MKEKIYTIPINESYDQDAECPFCYLEKKLEKEAVEYALGAAMMEPDYRIISNEKGYCNKHFSMMLAMPNKLSLALVLETHLKEVIEKTEKYNEKVNSSSSGNTGLFRKNKESLSKFIASETGKIQETCVICDKITETLKRYTEVFFYMWEKDEEFRKKVENSKGFCLKHFSMLCDNAEKQLKKPEEFLKTAYNLEIENLKRINEEVHRFTLKFDYRNKDMEWGTAIDAPVRAIEKLTGFTIAIKEDNNQ
ncbi:MAG: ABC transporter substrate-binding protein [Clostridia bacterium]|nr:ABC transporter substrate-binding protein [Clostridia bacterium]